MKLTLLVDNNTYIDRYYLGEPALSIYIEEGEERILFDTGYSCIFLDNAKAMGIDLSRLTKLVLSHGHVDHTGGLEALSANFDTRSLPLYGHPEVFREVSCDGINTGSPLRQEVLSSMYDLRLSAEPVWLSDKLLYLGEIPQLTNFEPRRVTGECCVHGIMHPDCDMDDTALVYLSKEGLFIITGCSHAGVCNIIEYACRLTGEKRVAGVLGGFHLFDVDERLHKTIDYFRQKNVASLNPCHCVSLRAKAEMMKHFSIPEAGVGMELSVE